MELVFGVVELLERILGEAFVFIGVGQRDVGNACLLYTSPSPRD